MRNPQCCISDDRPMFLKTTSGVLEYSMTNKMNEWTTEWLKCMGSLICVMYHICFFFVFMWADHNIRDRNTGTVISCRCYLMSYTIVFKLLFKPFKIIHWRKWCLFISTDMMVTKTNLFDSGDTPTYTTEFKRTMQTETRRGNDRYCHMIRCCFPFNAGKRLGQWGKKYLAQPWIDNSDVWNAEIPSAA